jgi:hypothetical protein
LVDEVELIPSEVLPESPAAASQAADPFAAPLENDPFAPAPASLDPFAGLQPQGGMQHAPYGAFGAPQPRSRSANPMAMALMIVGGIVGLGMICVVGIALWAFSGSDDEQVAELPNRSMPQAAPVTPPRSTTGSRSTNASRPQPRPQSTANSSTTSSNHFGRPPQSNTATGSGGSVTSDPLGASTASGSLSHGASGDVEPIADVPALSAGASVDSLPAELKVELPSSQLVSIPMPPRSLAFYSHCTSPFLAIVSQDKKEGQLWDLRSLEQSASFQPAMEWASSKAT